MPQIIADVFAVAYRTQVAAKGEMRLTMELLSGEQTQEKRNVILGRTKIERTEVRVLNPFILSGYALTMIGIFRVEKSCSSCGAMNISRLPRQTVLDKLLGIFLLRPYHCRRCYSKFYLFKRKDSGSLSSQALRQPSR